ncbi:MAG: CpsD/CapB family tyrosine-protein kinase [Candidatus Omnitrophica bacterium]|nr:CpsD/CapB family tyrosine-protein kinase [Candidatus Omnitrophota bacterium]
MGRITEALRKVSDERVEKIKKRPAPAYVAKRLDGAAIEEHVVTFHDPMSPISEQYNMLRTNIQQLKKSKRHKTFIITSSRDGEGKTVTSTNLAIAMARDSDNGSVLLVDADMRRGKAAEYLGIAASPGLAELLSGKADLGDVIITPGVADLEVVVSGKTPKNPSELLNSKKMKDVMAAFKSRYDYIIIDTPPVMSVADACILGPMADGVILVVQAGRTQRDMVKNSEKKVKQAGGEIAGFVMTKTEYHLPGYLSRYMQQYDSYYAYHEYKRNGTNHKESAA